MKVRAGMARRLALENGHKNGRPESPADGLENPCGGACVGSLLSWKTDISGCHDCDEQAAKPRSSDQQAGSQKDRVRIRTCKSKRQRTDRNCGEAEQHDIT